MKSKSTALPVGRISLKRPRARLALCFVLLSGIIGALVGPVAVAEDEPSDGRAVPVQATLATQTETPTPTPSETVPPLPTPTPSETATPLPTQTAQAESTPTEAGSVELTPAVTVTVSRTAGIEVETPAENALEFTVSSDGAAFGAVLPDGTISGGGSPGLVSHLVAGGADYVIPAAVTLRIRSDTNWTISCSIADEGSSGGLSASMLTWRITDQIEWQPFPSGEVILSGQPGSASIDLDFRLHVSWDTPPGVLSALVTFQATGIVGG